MLRQNIDKWENYPIQSINLNITSSSIQSTDTGY